MTLVPDADIAMMYTVVQKSHRQTDRDRDTHPHPGRV